MSLLKKLRNYKRFNKAWVVNAKTRGKYSPSIRKGWPGVSQRWPHFPESGGTNVLLAYSN